MDNQTEEKDGQATDTLQKLDAMAAALLRLRDEAVMARSLDGCERRMRQDEATLNESMEDEEPLDVTAVDYAAGKVVRRSVDSENQGSRVVVNVVRGRSEVNAGRFASAAMPTDDRNWELKPTPDTELDEQLSDTRPTSQATETGEPITGPDGQEATVRDVALEVKKQAEKKMNGMQTRIDDQLVECNAHTEFLRCIGSAVERGTGVIKGPFIIPSLKTRWKKYSDAEGEAWEQETREELKPALKFVSPWDCYPSPGCGDDQSRMNYHWEKGTISQGELRQLKHTKAPGYIQENIEKILKSPPVRTRITMEDGRRTVTQEEVDRGNTYERWEYHGEVTTEALEATGLKVDPNEKSLRACVLFVNDMPIKIVLYPLDSMGLIYHYFQWSKIPNSLFGAGVPRAAKWVQSVIKGAWRAMMDNAHAAAGGHLVVNGEGMVKIEQRGPVTVWQTSRDVDVRTAMAFFKIGSNQQSYQQIIEMALRFLDLETATPMAFQGDKVTMPETLGATNILVDSGNIAIESRLPWWEAQIMFPLLRKFYDFNMLDPDCPSEVKGDYNVSCKGVRSLQNKQAESKMIEEILALKQDPDFKFKYDWDDAIDQIFKQRKLNIKRRNEADVKADEEKAAQQQAPADPRIAAAQIKTQSDMQIAQLNQQADMAEIQAKGQAAEEQRKHDRWEKQVEFQIEQMKLNAAMQKTLDDIKAKMTIRAEELNLQRELSKPGSGGEVLTPPTEPGQKAAPGKSFED